MFSARDCINNPRVRAAIVCRFKTIIHVSRECHIDSIRIKGLEPRFIISPPIFIREYLSEKEVKILCLHPFGASFWPGMTGGALNDEKASQSKRITFSFSSENLPDRIGIDWSYYSIPDYGVDWGFNAEDVTVKIADRRGSIVSYDPVLPQFLRVFVNGASPANPDSWPSLLSVSAADIARHD